mmetsp:Transcript_2175/g.4842  ORF Transcript_2175/g.4842 Transcript_2175/m.4842 type:complete len:325 (-) Transcript_2175:104-1078(-)
MTQLTSAGALSTRPSVCKRVLQGLGIFCFNLLLVIFTLIPYLIAKFSVLSAKCKPLRARSWRRRAVLVSTCLAWRLALLCSCWIRVRVDGLAAFRSGLGRSGRSPVIVANHLSFLDTILLVTFMPLRRISNIKMFVSSHLLKMPFIGTITQAMGHMAVPFKTTESGRFDVDKEKMVERMRALEEHIAAGGCAGWYPEGTMNRKDIQEVQMFRAGGFGLATHLDVEVWCVSFQGNTVCWPASAPVGGRPARIGVRIAQLCESSHSHLAQGNVSDSDEQRATRHMAETSREMVQQGVKKLLEEGYGPPPESLVIDPSKPLLPGRDH